MEQNRSLTLLSWLHVALLFACFYPMIADIMHLAPSATALYCLSGIFLLLPVIVSWFAAAKLRRLLSYFLLGTLCSLGFGGLTGILGTVSDIGFYPMSIPAVILSALLFFLRGYARIRRDFHFMDVPHPLHWILFGLHYVAGALLKNDFYWRTVFYLFFLDVFVCFAFQFFYRFHHFLQTHSRTANLPLKTMQRVSKILFAITSILLVLFVLPSLFYGQELLAGLPNPESGTRLAMPFSPPEPIPEIQLDESLLFSDEAAFVLPPWVEQLFLIILYLIFAGVIFLVLIHIYHACRRAGALFSAETEDTIIFLDRAPTDADESRSKKRLRNMRSLSVNRQIRRHYKKVIQRALKQSPSGTETPTELETTAGLYGENSALLHHIYEKARYSDQPCTEDELAKIRESPR